MRGFSLACGLGLALTLSACNSDGSGTVGHVILQVRSLTLKNVDGTPYDGSAKICFKVGAKEHFYYYDIGWVAGCEDLKVSAGQIEPHAVKIPIDGHYDHDDNRFLHLWAEYEDIGYLGAEIYMKGLRMNVEVKGVGNGPGHFTKGGLGDVRKADDTAGDDGLADVSSAFTYEIEAHFTASLKSDPHGVATNTVDALEVLMPGNEWGDEPADTWDNVTHQGKPVLAYLPGELIAGSEVASEAAKARARAICEILGYETLAETPALKVVDGKAGSVSVQVVESLGGMLELIDTDREYDSEKQKWVGFGTFNKGFVCKRASAEGGTWEDTGPQTLDEALAIRR